MSRTARPLPAELAALAWPRGRLPEAVRALARASGLRSHAADEGHLEADLAPPAPDVPIGDWLNRAAAWLDLEVESITSTYVEIPSALGVAGPAILRAGEDGFWLLLATDPGKTGLPKPFGALSRLLGRRTEVAVLDPEGRICRVDGRALADHLRAHLDTRTRDELEASLEQIGIPARRREKALHSLLAATHADQTVWLGWLLRVAPHAPFGRRLEGPGFGRRTLIGRLATLLGAHALQYGLWLASWWWIGRAALGGHLGPGELAGWILMLLTLVPLRARIAWSLGELALDVGTALKGRFLQGALALEPDRARADGAGAALGRVIESESVEAMALGGGLTALTAAVELPIAAWVLWRGAGASALLAILFGAIATLLVLGWRYVRALGRSTDHRLRMTHELVEKMVGHQTRLAQEAPSERHRGEANRLDAYLDRLEARDRPARALLLLPRAWLWLAFAALAPSLLAAPSAGPAGTAGLAVALGGILLVRQALAALAPGLLSLAAAGIGWRAVLPLFRAGGQGPDLGLPSLPRLGGPPRNDVGDVESSPDGVPGTAPVDDGPAVVRASRLSYAYPGRSRAVFEGCTLDIHQGDRILVEGPSGGGKSTLGALLAGLRPPSSGLLTLYGMDRGSVGLPAWRRRVVLVPQFHDNHVLTETFAFNLLMGRSWPPTPAVLAEAEQVCRELGLGELLERMPAGLLQVVGETGWQLSHGERGRLFLARAILQDPDLLVLDESFAALDPETLERALECTLRRGRTVVVIAHP